VGLQKGEKVAEELGRSGKTRSPPNRQGIQMVSEPDPQAVNMLEKISASSA
jgi:hypothetical protein